MEHGTLAVKIRQADYRSFLLTLYGLVCYAADSGNRYSPEDALIPGGYAGEGLKYWWSAVINSVLQPTMGLRWLLCYEESDQPVCHLQKAAPKHWFAPQEVIAVAHCPTRFGALGWRTESLPGPLWNIELTLPPQFAATLRIYVRPPNGAPLQSATLGKLEGDCIVLAPEALAGKGIVTLQVR